MGAMLLAAFYPRPRPEESALPTRARKARLSWRGAVDLPLAILALTLWAYWAGVGRMVVRARRKGRRSGLVPAQRIEKLMWVVWVPLVLAWLVLPVLALFADAPPLAAPSWATRGRAFALLRWSAAACAAACFLATASSWRSMGRRWRMAVVPGERTDLVTTGLYARVRHPIYAFSILLMLSSAVILPTAPMLAIATTHIALLVLKARNEERFLLGAHGSAYEEYRRRTGAFLPRAGGRRP
jgi:protein-S-isoprenylcysteine O-methyltransferase Ste14